MTVGDTVFVLHNAFEDIDTAAVRPARVTEFFANGKAVEVEYADGSRGKFKVLTGDGVRLVLCDEAEAVAELDRFRAWWASGGLVDPAPPRG